MEKDTIKALNKLAREQTKYKLQCDIAFDLQVCQLEGYNPVEYLEELKQIIDNYLRLFRKG